MSNHEWIRERLGAFVLGGLDETQAETVREHLATCARCRAEVDDLAPLAGPLRWVDPDDPEPEVPVSLDRAVHDWIARQDPASGPTRPPRRRLLLVAAAAAVVGVLAGGAVVAVLDDDPPVVTAAPVEPVAGIDTDAGVRLDADLVDHTWGLEIMLVGSGFRAGQAYDVVVVDSAGRRHTSGAFVGVGSTEMTCELSSAVLRADAASFDVVAADGEVVAHADL